MRSTARFLEGTLLGVALGVGLGFFVFRKSSRKALTELWSPALQPGAQQDWTPPRPTGEIVETAPAVAEDTGPEYAQVGLAAGSEVESVAEVTPEVFEESPEEMPTLPREMEAYTAVEVEPIDVESIPVWAEIPLPQVNIEPDAEVAVDELQSEESVVPEAGVEEREEEIVALEQEVAEEATEEATEEAAEEGEQVEIEATAVPAPTDDLKARIEETRRRIRRELEQPFIIGGGAVSDEASLSSEVEPAIGEALAVEPSSEEQLSSQPHESADSTVGGSEIDLTGAEDQQITEQGEVVNYDAMRSRIEETRSRLKAKAFDAMMTGESALLGRDAEGAEANLPAASEVDGEIVQTIEETLREEES